jgi:hypothetical protein
MEPYLYSSTRLHDDEREIYLFNLEDGALQQLDILRICVCANINGPVTYRTHEYNFQLQRKRKSKEKERV